MADISITAANVSANSSFALNTLMVGSTVLSASTTITAGQVVYLNGTQYALAKSNASGTASALGIALNNATSGQPVVVLLDGIINIGATVTVGQTYVVSAANAGGIAPITDLASTNYVTILGVANTSSTINIDINNSGVVKP